MLVQSQLQQGRRNRGKDPSNTGNDLKEAVGGHMQKQVLRSKFYNGFKWAHVELMRSQFLIEGAVPKGKRGTDVHAVVKGAPPGSTLVFVIRTMSSRLSHAGGSLASLSAMASLPLNLPSPGDDIDESL